MNNIISNGFYLLSYNEMSKSKLKSNGIYLVTNDSANFESDLSGNELVFLVNSSLRCPIHVFPSCAERYDLRRYDSIDLLHPVFSDNETKGMTDLDIKLILSKGNFFVLCYPKNDKNLVYLGVRSDKDYLVNITELSEENLERAHNYLLKNM